MAKKKKKYEITLDMKYSHSFVVNANTKRDAEKIAFERIRKSLKKSMFTCYTDLNNF